MEMNTSFEGEELKMNFVLPLNLRMVYDFLLKTIQEVKEIVRIAGSKQENKIGSL